RHGTDPEEPDPGPVRGRGRRLPPGSNVAELITHSVVSGEGCIAACGAPPTTHRSPAGALRENVDGQRSRCPTPTDGRDARPPHRKVGNLGTADRRYGSGCDLGRHRDGGE